MISELRSKLHQIFSHSPVISAVILTFVMFICFVILILIPAEADVPDGYSRSAGSGSGDVSAVAHLFQYQFPV